VSDIDTAAADGLKVLDPKRPIREADIRWHDLNARLGPGTDSCTAANCAPQIAKLLNHLVGAREHGLRDGEV